MYVASLFDPSLEENRDVVMIKIMGSGMHHLFQNHMKKSDGACSVTTGIWTRIGSTSNREVIHWAMYRLTFLNIQTRPFKKHWLHDWKCILNRCIQQMLYRQLFKWTHFRRLIKVNRYSYGLEKSTNTVPVIDSKPNIYDFPCNFKQQLWSNCQCNYSGSNWFEQRLVL